MQQQPIGHWIQGAAGSLLSQVACRKRVNHVQSGQIGQSSGIDHRQITDQSAPASSPDSRLRHADRQNAPLELGPGWRTTLRRWSLQIPPTRRPARPRCSPGHAAAARSPDSADGADCGSRGRRSRRVIPARVPCTQPVLPGLAAQSARTSVRRQTDSDRLLGVSGAKDEQVSRDVVLPPWQPFATPECATTAGGRSAGTSYPRNRRPH